MLLVLTISAAGLTFALWMLVMVWVQRVDRLKGRCACRRAEEILTQWQTSRQNNGESHFAYDAATVNPASLPIVQRYE